MRKYVFGEPLLKARDIRTYGFEVPYDIEDRKRLRGLISDIARRCLDPRDKYFHMYGGRGITVCDEWVNPKTMRPNIKAWLRWIIGNGWKRGLQIDRIDNSKGYYPENCRLVEPKVNCRNRRSNRLLTLNGETKTMAEWAECLGMSYKAIEHRVNRGLSDEEALTREVTRGHEHMIEFRGERLNTKQMAEKYGITRTAFHARIVRGWSLEDALLTPFGARRGERRLSA